MNFLFPYQEIARFAETERKLIRKLAFNVVKFGYYVCLITKAENIVSLCISKRKSTENRPD